MPLPADEPEFFYPRGDWSAKKYTVALTVTQAVADASNGGVLYYFCHIHSKMSGKIQLLNADGSKYTNSKPEKSLYDAPTIDVVDHTCGTTGMGKYAGGGSDVCSERFLCGALDSTFEKCLQAVDCSMNKEMNAEAQADPADAAGLIAHFMQQMIPHHENAVNMAKTLLKLEAPAAITAAMDEDALTGILWNIINVQNFQIHNFRNYLNALTDASSPSGTKLLEPKPASSSSDGLSVGALIGIGVGGAVLLVLSVLVVCKGPVKCKGSNVKADVSPGKGGAPDGGMQKV